jgi:hypothetical protein
MEVSGQSQETTALPPEKNNNIIKIGWMEMLYNFYS